LKEIKKNNGNYNTSYAEWFCFLPVVTVLGTRTGEEKTNDWSVATKIETANAIDNDNVIVLPNRKVNNKNSHTQSENKRPFEQALTELKEKDPTFNEHIFLAGSSRAFEKIVLAYANSDHTLLKKLLSKDVYTKFAEAIDQRENNNNLLEASIDYIDAEIIDIKITKISASVTVQFKGEQMLATVNADGVSHDNPARLKTKIVDIWTFKRSFSSSSTIWLLVKTESKND
jgi:predicted lipid-binding transport protein (Tim44 family)